MPATKTYRRCLAKVVMVANGDRDLIRDFKNRTVVLTDHGCDMNVAVETGCESCTINEYKGDSNPTVMELSGHALWTFKRLTEWKDMYEVEMLGKHDDAGEWTVRRAGVFVCAFEFTSAIQRKAMRAAAYAYVEVLNKDLA